MPDSPAQKLRVLVVDDNADSATMLATLLKTSGIGALVATDGAQALDAFDQFRPHAVLLDLGMPGMDGFEVCRRVRQLPNSGAVLIVIVSGYVRDEHKVQAIDAGANYYFVKPVDPAKLLLLIEQHGASH